MDRFLEHASGVSDFLQGPVAMSGFDVDCAGGIGNHVHCEAFTDGIQCGRTHAVVLSQSTNPEMLYMRAAQPVSEKRILREIDRWWSEAG